MTLAGTRPPTLDEWNKYELHHRARLAIKPGITGMWQVSGRSEITDFEEVVKLDTEYISEWNVGMDIKLLWKEVIGDRMDESLVRGTAESSSRNSEEYRADAMRGTNYLQFSNDGNENKDNDNE